MLRDDIELARRAIDRGYITSEQFREVLASAGTNNTPSTVGSPTSAAIGTLLVQSGYLKPEQLTELLGELHPVSEEPGEAVEATPSPTAPEPIPPKTDVSPTSPFPTPPGSQTFGKFMLINRLGEGRSGTLFRAWQKNLRRWVTLRLPSSGSPTDRARFLEGAQRAAMLEHANILRTFEVGLHDEMPFSATEYLKGRTLDQALALPQRKRVEFMAEAAAAIQFAHDRQVIHGNITPTNILLTDTGDTATPERVVVVDFAIPTSGLCPYSAPEHLSPTAAPTIASDIYQFGATLYHALVGRAPYESAPPDDLAAQIRHHDPAWPREVDARIPVELDSIVRKAMARAPEGRYAAIREIAGDLRAWLRRGTIASKRRLARVQDRHHSRLRLRLIFIVAGVLVLLTLATVLWKTVFNVKDTPVPQQQTTQGATDRALPHLQEGRTRLQQAQQLLSQPVATLEPFYAGVREAIEHFDRALRECPELATAHLERAQALSWLPDREEEAERAYAKAIENNESSGAALLGRAELRLRRCASRVESVRSREVAQRLKDSTAAAAPNPFASDRELQRNGPLIVADLRAALQKAMTPYATALAQAEMLWLQGALEQARDAFDDLCAKYADKHEVFMLRGRIRRYLAMEQLGTAVPEGERLNRYTQSLMQAAEDFDAARKLCLNNVSALLEAGMTHLEVRTPQALQGASSRFSDALRLNSKCVAAYYFRGQCCLEQGKPRDAKLDFARCYELAPSRRDYLELRAYSAWLATDQLDLEDASRKLCDKFASSASSWLFSAFRRQLEDNWEESDRALAKGLELSPANPHLLSERGLVAEFRDRLGEAADHYGHALEKQENLIRVRVMRMGALAFSNNLPRAVAEAKSLASHRDAETLAACGTILLMAGDVQNSLPLLEQAVGMQNHPVYAVGNLGLIHLLLGDASRASQILEQAYREARAKSMDPKMPPQQTGALRQFWFAILVNRTLALVALKDAEEALKMASEAAMWHGDNVWAQYALMLAHEAKGNAEQAAKAREKAGTLPPLRGLLMVARRRWHELHLEFGPPDVEPLAHDLWHEVVPPLRETHPLIAK